MPISKSKSTAHFTDKTLSRAMSICSIAYVDSDRLNMYCMFEWNCMISSVIQTLGQNSGKISFCRVWYVAGWVIRKSMVARMTVADLLELARICNSDSNMSSSSLRPCHMKESSMSGLVTALGLKRSAMSFLAMLGKGSLLLVPEKAHQSGWCELFAVLEITGG